MHDGRFGILGSSVGGGGRASRKGSDLGWARKYRVPIAMLLCQSFGVVALLCVYMRGSPSTSNLSPSSNGFTNRNVARRTKTIDLDFSAYDRLLAEAQDSEKLAGKIPEVASRTFKFFGDPDVCNRYPWKFCYIQGNLRLVRKVLLNLGWREVLPETPIAHLTWSLADLADDKSYAYYHTLTPGLMVNHFPGIFELGNKKYLSKNRCP